jgi:hypothetical protein
MSALTHTLSPVHYLPKAQPIARQSASVPQPKLAPLVDERLFGDEAAQALRAEDQFALTAVSCILFAIVTAGCLLMVGTVAAVLLGLW